MFLRGNEWPLGMKWHFMYERMKMYLYQQDVHPQLFEWFQSFLWKCWFVFLILSVEELTGTFLFLFPLSRRMDCYNSSDPAAVNATIVYDYNDHQGDLWSRTIEDVQDQPLLHCSSTSLPLETQCTVCLNQVVYAVCHKLKDGVVLTMEALERHIKISKSGKKLSHSCSRHPGGFRVVAVHVDGSSINGDSKKMSDTQKRLFLYTFLRVWKDLCCHCCDV